MTDLFAAPTPCGTPSLHGSHVCVLPKGHYGLHANKTVAEVTPMGSRIVWQLADDADRICGDEYDGEECELEPGHAGAHLSGNLAWSYGRAALQHPSA